MIVNNVRNFAWSDWYFGHLAAFLATKSNLHQLVTDIDDALFGRIQANEQYVLQQLLPAPTCYKYVLRIRKYDYTLSINTYYDDRFKLLSLYINNNNRMRITSIVLMVKNGAHEARNSTDMVTSILMVLSMLLAIGVGVLLPSRLDVWPSALTTFGCPLAAATARWRLHK